MYRRLPRNDRWIMRTRNDQINALRRQFLALVRTVYRCRNASTLPEHTRESIRRTITTLNTPFQ